MQVTLIHIHPRPGSSLPFDEDVRRYLKQASPWLDVDSKGFATEQDLVAHIARMKQRPALLLCDSRGKGLSSEQFAAWIGARRDAGTAQILMAIGPADGWSAAILDRADLRLAFGPITLPHALARLVLAEQVYRAATILGGHPYHLGH